jgi:hypothetical protein
MVPNSPLGFHQIEEDRPMIKTIAAAAVISLGLAGYAFAEDAAAPMPAPMHHVHHHVHHHYHHHTMHHASHHHHATKMAPAAPNS